MNKIVETVLIPGKNFSFMNWVDVFLVLVFSLLYGAGWHRVYPGFAGFITGPVVLYLVIFLFIYS